MTLLMLFLHISHLKKRVQIIGAFVLSMEKKRHHFLSMPTSSFIIVLAAMPAEMP